MHQVKRFKNQVAHCLRNQMHLLKSLRNQVGIWIISKIRWSLLLTRLKKMGLLTQLTKKRKSKHNVMEEAITSLISAKKNIDTVNKTEKSQTSKK